MLEGGERLLERRLPIPLVGLVEVDVVGAEPPHAGLTGPDGMMAGGARLVRPVSHRKAGLGGRDDIVPAGPKRLTDDLLRLAHRVNVRRVDQVDAGLEGKVDLTPGVLRVAGADIAEHAATTEPHRAQRHGRNAQARAPELPVFNGFSFGTVISRESLGIAQ
jgi:hypothetical protein